MGIQVILSIIGMFTTIIPVLIKQHYNHKTTIKNQEKLEGLITSKDVEQDERLKALNKKLEFVEEYIKEERYKKSLINKLRDVSSNIRNLSTINNTSMIDLLDNISINYIHIIDRIVNTELSKLQLEDIENEIKALARSVKNNICFNKMDIENQDKLLESLKLEVLQVNMKMFLNRLNGEIKKDSNKYNGTFERLSMDTLANILKDTIQVYKENRK